MDLDLELEKNLHGLERKKNQVRSTTRMKVVIMKTGSIMKRSLGGVALNFMILQNKFGNMKEVMMNNQIQIL